MEWRTAFNRSRRVDQATLELNRTIGTNIALCRHMRGLSSGELAGAAAISEGVLARYESGCGRVPAGDLVRIIEACDVPVSRMFSRMDGPLPLQTESAALGHAAASRHPS